MPFFCVTGKIKVFLVGLQLISLKECVYYICLVLMMFCGKLKFGIDNFMKIIYN